MEKEKIIIDAEGSPLGRIASHAAKQSLLGKSVVIINCNKTVISGRKAYVAKAYGIKRARKSSSLKGPNFPRVPEKIMKRTVRGMLSYKQGRGKAALRRVLCYNEVPAEYLESKKIKLPGVFKSKTITLKELSQIV